MKYLEGKLILCSGTEEASFPKGNAPSDRISRKGPNPPESSPQKNGHSSSAPKLTQGRPSFAASENKSYSPVSVTTKGEHLTPKSIGSMVNGYPPRSDVVTNSRTLEGTKESQIQRLSRPAHGTVGKAINLQTNCFMADLDTSIQLYRYHIHVAPEPKTPWERRRAFELFLKEGSCLEDSRHSDALKVFATDNRSTLVTVKPLKLGDSGQGQCQVAYYEKNEDRPKEILTVHNHVFTISFAKTQPLPLEKLRDYLASMTLQSPFGLKGSLLQVLNIAMSQKTLSITEPAETKDKKIFTKHKHEPLRTLGGGLVVLENCCTTVKTASLGLLINISPKFASFYRAGPLVDLIREFKMSKKGSDQLHEFLKGVRVEILHLTSKSGSPKIKNITGLAFLPTLGANANQATFIWERKETSVTNYYQQSKCTRRDNTDCPQNGCH